MTLALYLVGGLPLLRSVLVFIAQILGGLAAAGVVSCLFPGSLNVETTLGGGTSISRGLFIEMFLTTQLVFVVIMLAAVKHKATYLAPVGIGLSFFVTEMAGKADASEEQTVSSSFTDVSRYLLHRWLAQLRSLARPCGGQPPLPGVFLDLLRRTVAGLTSGVWVLLPAEPSTVSDLQSGAGL